MVSNTRNVCVHLPFVIILNKKSTVILSFLKRKREGPVNVVLQTFLTVDHIQYGDVLERSPFLDVKRSWPILIISGLKKVENGQKRSWNVHENGQKRLETFEP